MACFLYQQQKMDECISREADSKHVVGRCSEFSENTILHHARSSEEDLKQVRWCLQKTLVIANLWGQDLWFVWFSQGSLQPLPTKYFNKTTHQYGNQWGLIKSCRTQSNPCYRLFCVQSIGFQFFFTLRSPFEKKYSPALFHKKTQPPP